MRIVTKSQFAELCNVHRSAVSKWIESGLISGDALDGTGRTARIVVDVALAQVKRRRDVGQAHGNGLATRLPLVPGRAEPEKKSRPLPLSLTLLERPPVPAELSEADVVDERIKAGKLEAIERANRIAAGEEAARTGRYVLTADARREMGRIASNLMLVLEQSLGTFATAIAERFQVPQRDALHLLRSEFRKIRERAAERHVLEAAELPRYVGDSDLEPDEGETDAPDVALGGHHGLPS